MISATFTPEMREQLMGLKGKTFKSYVYNKEGRFERAYGNLRINLGRSAIDVMCIQHPVDDYFGEPEDMAYFTCEPADPKSDFVPYIEGRALAYMVDEVITGVELVNDYVNYDGGDCIIDMDMALVIRTKYHTFTFSRGIWFDETISIAVSDADEAPKGIGSIEKLWYDEEEDEQPTVRRSVAVLC